MLFQFKEKVSQVNWLGESRSHRENGSMVLVWPYYAFLLALIRLEELYKFLSTIKECEIDESWVWGETEKL